MSGWAQRPTVCAVMLVNGREAMVRRAIASFRAQTYEPKRLLILDSAVDCQRDTPYGESDATSVHMPDMNGKTIGALRNAANWCAADHFGADLIAHFDSDDISHPRRIEEQVALLKSSGKQCVGYRELLFWDTRVAQIQVYPTRRGPDGTGCLGIVKSVGESWIYRNHQANWAAGASMLYRRELWERQPFDDAPHEDQRWMMTPAVSAECIGVSSIPPMTDPRLICQMHGANTEQISRQKMLSNPDVWLRALEFDDYCERMMQL
jgi:cellulose synthase/poly-beta-1,6-N-acetylglucosamine synthase-like glycosyltransferase